MDLLTWKHQTKKTRHHWCKFYTKLVHISTSFMRNTTVKALLSEKLVALHYAPATFSNQIEEARIQWSPRHLAVHNVPRNQFSSKLSLHCLPADTRFSFYCKAKNRVKIGESIEQMRCGGALHHLQQSRQMLGIGALSEPSVSSSSPVRGRRTGRWIKQSHSVGHCADYRCYAFIIWAPRYEFAIIKPFVPQQ